MDTMTNSVETPAPAAEVKLPERSKMEEELYRLSIPSLLQFLDGFGYVARENTSKAELVQAILHLHEKKLADSKEVVAQATAQVASDDDPIVTMTFMSLESPNASYEFTYAGPKGFQKGPNGKVLPAPKWSFIHNNKYNVPYCVVKHLNSLRVPADHQVQTNSEGFIQNLYSGDSSRQPRFSCILELTPEQERRIISKE